jgi:hypothetical protein
MITICTKINVFRRITAFWASKSGNEPKMCWENAIFINAYNDCRLATPPVLICYRISGHFNQVSGE